MVLAFDHVVNIIGEAFFGLANVGAFLVEFLIEALNISLILKEFLRSEISDILLLEVTVKLSQLAFQVLFKILMMELTDENLLKRPLDIFRNVKIIKWSLRIDHPDVNEFQDLLGIK